MRLNRLAEAWMSGDSAPLSFDDFGDHTVLPPPWCLTLTGWFCHWCLHLGEMTFCSQSPYPWPIHSSCSYVCKWYLHQKLPPNPVTPDRSATLWCEETFPANTLKSPVSTMRVLHSARALRTFWIKDDLSWCFTGFQLPPAAAFVLGLKLRKDSFNHAWLQITQAVDMLDSSPEDRCWEAEW